MDYSQLPSGDLAYLGDSVLELLVRKRLIESGLTGSGKLNKKSLEFVTAVAQADAFDRIEDVLTDAEINVYRRARNMNKSPAPKSASVLQYRKATGFEALFAYLYLSGEYERMYYLFDLAYNIKDN